MFRQAVFLLFLRLPALLQNEPVTDHRNEFTIGGLALGVGDGVAKVLLQGLQVAPVPGHLDGVADACA